jgi:3-hydroxyisobutyrate dehydrogenase-like beta-hydroxyacid dehydrogenase
MAGIGILHPGEMGAALGACLAGRGHRVRWAGAGRSADTARRAGAAGMEDAGALPALLGDVEAVVSVCPPHAALDVAREAAGHRFAGLYLDANAVSPATAAEIGRVVAGGGARWVDGGIVGPPPVAPGTTRLFLSGGHAGEAAALFDSSPVDVVALDGDTAASALKMAYAAWTKGSAALLLTARALAEANGVGEPLLAEWARSQPELARRLEQAAAAAAGKGWRWVGEMEEIAAAMRAAGLPEGQHEASADVYRRVPRSTDPTVAAVLEALGSL